MSWYCESEGNGARVTIYAPDGRTAFLQGDDAANFLRDAEACHTCGCRHRMAIGAHYTIADLCAEYDAVATLGEAFT